ncbi:MAG: CDP-alcohol phosphatidyltransferase family protein, partial [Devosia sp.]|nr:CDP-alcohol phosphatidyltransferase family protein [Devosia sp.]
MAELLRHGETPLVSKKPLAGEGSALDHATLFLFPRAMPNRSQFASLPNIVTIGRILLIPVICWMLVTGSMELRAVALLIYVVAAASDWVDGYLARRFDLG